MKPTVKLLWQECNACVEKKQAMAGCMAEDKQYLKVPNREMRCKSSERRKWRNHTNENNEKGHFPRITQNKRVPCMPNSMDACDQHLATNICIQKPRTSSQRGKKWFLKAWVSKRTWQDYRHRNKVQGGYRGEFGLKYRVCCCKWLSCRKDFWQ